MQGAFETFSVDADEEEHSIEMQLPYIAACLSQAGSSAKVVPIVVGSIGAKQERAFGQLLAPYLAQEGTVFVVSSDFCHWGSRFRYTRHDKANGEIWQSIEKMDKDGIEVRGLYGTRAAHRNA